MADPALAGRDDLGDAGGDEGGDEPVDVPPVLGDGVADPEALDPAQLGWLKGPTEPLLDRRPFVQRAGPSFASATARTSASRVRERRSIRIITMMRTIAP